MPKNPENVEAINEAFEDANIFKVFGQTAHKVDPERLFDGAIRKETHSFCVFSSKKIIKMVEENVDEYHVLMDATFKIVPIGQFQQLLILYFRIKHEACFFEFAFLQNFI